MNGYKKTIYFLVTLIIFFAIILLFKIRNTPKYDPKIYNEIYDEYENIFGEDTDIQENKGIGIQNIQENNNITENNGKKTTVSETSYPSTEQSNIIGKIIIPKIDIQYPIIKETTTEYLKIAPTKYCGPEVNEIRKFSYSGA